MVLINFEELIALIIVSLVIGFIFTGLFVRRPRTIYERINPRKFNFDDFKFSLLITAPAIIFHELAHKFVAMAYGYSATFELFPFGLGLGLLLKLLNSPFIIIAPGYVVISELAIANDLAYRLIAFAGPAVNLVFWLGSVYLLKTKKNLSMMQTASLKLIRIINMWLFFFNMIPFPPLDGSKVFFGAPS